MENSTKINMPTINADDIIEKAAIGRVKELDTLVNNMADSLSKAASGKNLSKYWKTQDELIKDVITSYKTYNKVSNKDNATELIKVTNALKAIAGVDLSNILPNFDEFTKSLNSAEKKIGNLDGDFSIKSFKEVFDVFKALEQQGLNVQKIFSHFGVSSDVGELQQAVRSLKNEVADLTRRLLDADNANEELRNEFDDFKAGSGIAKKLDELDRLKAEMQNVRNEAILTFNQFLGANKIDRYDWLGDDRFAEYFEQLENGTLTATDAIRQFKSEYAHLLEDSYRSSGNSFGLEQLQAFSEKLDSIFHQVEETAKKINDIISNGVIAKSVQNLSEDTTLSDSQRSIFGNMLQDEEALKSIKSLFQKIVEESNNAKNTKIFNTEQFAKVETIFEHIESTLSAIKSVLVDVGEGEELSPLLKMLDDIREAASNIKLGLNIDLGSEISEKLDQNVSQATQRQVTAYQKLLKEMFKAKSNKEMFDFYRNGIPENASNSELVGIYKGIIKRAEDAGKIGNTNIYKKKLGSVYDELKREIKNANAQLNRAEAKRSENGILGDLFGNSTDLSGVIEQLNIIVSKLDEISESAKGFTEAFKDGLNVNASVEEIEKLTNRVKELEDELAKVKTPTTVATSQESNISSGIKNAFSDSSTDTKPETEGMEQVEKATEEAVQAKKDFATANKGVQSSIDGSENPLKLEAELMEQIAKSAREAADAKKEFVEANKQVKDSADKSNTDLVGGHSENAEPSGVKKYKKKGYKAHDTGNHDNEKKVSNKAELEQALRELQSEIVDSIDESTSFVKEITDFYDSQNDLVKTQTKVGDKNGGVRTYTHSYSTDKEGNTTAWTSHIDSKKYQEQNKIIQEQIKNLQKLSAEKEKVAESERKSTVNQASKDQLEAWKQIQRIRKEIANTNNAKLIEQLKQEKKTYQEQYLTATNILKNNSDLYNSEQRLNELKKISLKTTQQIETSQQRQLNGYDNKLSGYQGKVSGYAATINKFGDDGWTSPEYLGKVQEARETLRLYQEAINELKANPDLINKESLANVERLGKNFEKTTLAIKNMTAAQKGYTQLGAEKTMDKISQMLKENSKMSRKAKADIKAWYDQIKSGNPSASLDVILGKVEAIVRAEKDAGRGGKSMWDAIKEKAFYSAATALGTYFGVNDILRYGGEVVNTVKDLNTQITELAKVSEQSSKQIYSDFDSYADIAKEVRGTISDTIAATADWSKNGYSIPDAKQLAEISQLYKNVGDGINIDEANESLISTLKGFKLEADQAEHIVDVFNEVSNNEAISSAGIGDALQRSAASFNAANTSLEQSVALVTATNSVLQDPEKVGNMWKTVSARIRGAKTELTDMGEDTDGLVESTSKLQALVKGITGVDILESDGKTFKDIYTIVSGISEKWATLSDIDRASLLESLAGKNQSNALAAALSQPEILKKAYEEATNAEGSARKENEEYAKSVQASIDLTKAKLEELSNDLLSSDFLKGAIDAGGKLIDILDAIAKSGNAIPAVASAIGAALSFKNVGIDTLVAY